MLGPLLSVKQARESSWSLDSSGIEKSPVFTRAVGNAGPEMGMEGGFCWLSVWAPVAQGGVRQELNSHLCQLGETPFASCSGR